jgi:hypothetical protein
VRQFSFSVSPTYCRGAPPLPEAPSLRALLVVPAIIIAILAFALVWFF